MSYELTKFLLTVSIAIFVGYITLVSIAYFSIIRRLQKKKFHRRIYLKAQTLQLLIYQYHKIRIGAQFMFAIFSMSLILTVLGYYFSPFGLKMVFAMNNSTNKITAFTPRDRAEVLKVDNTQIIKQTGDFIYFNTSLPVDFDKAKLSITYSNPYPDQKLSIGYKNGNAWQYTQKTFHNPMINNLGWNVINNNTFSLYQREIKYKSVESFMNNIPRNEIIGLLDIDMNILNPFNIIQDYKPMDKLNIIDTPLRGGHTLYVYLKNEPFNMTFYKQDLNWYKGEDIVTISVFKDNIEVIKVQSNDDGITDESRTVKPVQEISVKNPGPGYPEAGVYKVVINAPGDTVIKRIETNLSKLVFTNSIYPVNNHLVYGQIIKDTKPILLFSDALILSAETHHRKALQNIKINNKAIGIKGVDIEYSATPSANSLSEIYSPNSDVILKGTLGNFSFSEESYFNPMKYLIYPLKSEKDIDLVDYILTDYRKPLSNRYFYTAEIEVNLNNAVKKGNELSWIIRAPNLKKNSRAIIIKDLNVEFIKSPNKLFTN